MSFFASLAFYLDNFVDSLNEFVCFKTIFIGILLIGLWYYLFWKPFDYYRDYRKSGGKFEDVDRCRRNMINELQRRKKLGDLPPAYPNGWYALMESDKLKREEVKEVNILGLNLVAWRGASGRAYVSDAYCPHLGSHLGVGGAVSKECITCPFHQWSFEGPTGNLVNIPYSPNSCKNNNSSKNNGSVNKNEISITSGSISTNGSISEVAKLKMQTIVEMNDFIFLWFHAEGEDPSWYPESIPEISNGAMKYRGRAEFKIACHVQEVAENGADVNHLNTLHQPATMLGETPLNAKYTWSRIQHVWTGDWNTFDEKEKKHMYLTKFTHHINIFDLWKVAHVKLNLMQYGPGIIAVEVSAHLGRGILLLMTTPLEPLLQKVTHRLYTTSGIIQPLAKMILVGDIIQFSREALIWNRKKLLKNPMLPKEDSTIKKYRSWYQQFYSENSPRHYFAKTSAENEDESYYSYL